MQSCQLTTISFSGMYIEHLLLRNVLEVKALSWSPQKRGFLPKIIPNYLTHLLENLRGQGHDLRHVWTITPCHQGLRSLLSFERGAASRRIYLSFDPRFTFAPFGLVLKRPMLNETDETFIEHCSQVIPLPVLLMAKPKKTSIKEYVLVTSELLNCIANGSYI